MKKQKILNFLLIATSLIGYLEWSGGNHIFLIAGEAEILAKLFTDPSSVIHPFILLPLLGQILLSFTLLQKEPSKVLTYICIAALGLLLGFMFIIGIITFNYKIAFSTIPFIVTAIITIRLNIKMNVNKRTKVNAL